MRALTVQQPWAWAIFHGKDIENRTQQWSYRGPLAIHAGMRESERGINDPRMYDLFVKHWYDAQLGHFLGVVDLVDCHPDLGCCRPWGESAYVEHGGRERRHIVHLVLENPRALADPIPCRGALGLWTPPADIVERLP